MRCLLKQCCMGTTMACTFAPCMHACGVREPAPAPAAAICLCGEVDNPLCLVIAFLQGLKRQALAKRGQRIEVLDGLMTCSPPPACHVPPAEC